MWILYGELNKRQNLTEDGDDTLSENRENNEVQRYGSLWDHLKYKESPGSMTIKDETPQFQR